MPHAQTAARANWLTDGGDPQRTSWQRHETLISPASVKNMALMWKLKLDNQPREMHNLFAPLILSDLQLPAERAKCRCRRHLRQDGREEREAATHTGLAFDGGTGAELWSSGDQITSFSHFSSLAVANGRVYLGTYDGTLYCFGVKPTATK